MKRCGFQGRALRSWVFGCSAWIALSCSSESNGTDASAPGAGSGGGGSAGGVTYAQFVAEQVRITCEAIMGHPIPKDDQLGARVQFETVARCRMYYDELQRRSPRQVALQQAVESGTIIFDAQSAERFLAAAEGDWTAVRFDVRSYRDVLQGTVAEGQACYQSEECADGGYCAAENRSCPGTCRSRKPVGSACDSGEECEDATGIAECDYSVEPSVCVALAVRHNAGEGEPCGIVLGDRVLCSPELWCDGSYSGQGVCRPPIPVGAPCADSDQPCEGLSFCGADDVNDTCQRVAIVHEAGGLCDEGPGIRPRMCDPLSSLLCVSGVCELSGDGSEGSRCLPGDEGDLSCQRGLYCSRDTDPPTCRALEPPGSECTGSPECTLSCDYETRTCADRYCGVN